MKKSERARTAWTLETVFLVQQLSSYIYRSQFAETLQIQVVREPRNGLNKSQVKWPNIPGNITE